MAQSGKSWKALISDKVTLYVCAERQKASLGSLQARLEVEVKKKKGSIGAPLV
jgi:hypothetical protein